MDENIGKRIKFYRKQAGLTQDKLSEAVGFSTQNLKLIENCASPTSLENFIRICKALDVPADFILADEDKKFKFASVAQMIERLTKLDDSEFDSIAKSIEMIYFYKIFNKRSDKQEE